MQVQSAGRLHTGLRFLLCNGGHGLRSGGVSTGQPAQHGICTAATAVGMCVASPNTKLGGERRRVQMYVDNVFSARH